MFRTKRVREKKNSRQVRKCRIHKVWRAITAITRCLRRQHNNVPHPISTCMETALKMVPSVVCFKSQERFDRVSQAQRGGTTGCKSCRKPRKPTRS